MKLCFLIDEICAGSSSVIAGEMVRGMRKRGVEVEVVAIVKRPIDEKMLENLEDVSIRYISDSFPAWFNALDFKFWGFSFFSLHHLMYMPFARWIFKDYDLIISSCHYTTFLSRPSGKPYLLMLWRKAEETIRTEYKDKLWLLPFAKLLDWWAEGGARAILISNHWYQWVNKSVYYLYPGCHPLKELPKERTKAYFSYDRWDRANDPSKLLDYCKGLLNDTWNLLIAGYWHDKTLQDKFWAKAKQLGYENYIKDLGPLSQSEIYKILSGSPYHFHLPKEPFGMQTLEAMACGCGFVCHPESGVMDLIDTKKIYYFEDIWNQAKKNTWEHYCDKLLEAVNEQTGNS